jgi:hypothetical protein
MARIAAGTREGILVGVALLAAFVFFVFAVVLSYQTSLETRIMSPSVSPLVRYHVYFMVSLAALGIAVGASVFYFMSRRVDSTQNVAKRSAEIMLKFLSPDDRMVVEALLTKGGSMLQRDLSREHGLSKVKAHRVVMRLAERGIVSADEHGKTNRIRLAPEILAALR